MATLWRIIMKTSGILLGFVSCNKTVQAFLKTEIEIILEKCNRRQTAFQSSQVHRGQKKTWDLTLRQPPAFVLFFYFFYFNRWHTFFFLNFKSQKAEKWISIVLLTKRWVDGGNGDHAKQMPHVMTSNHLQSGLVCCLFSNLQAGCSFAREYYFSQLDVDFSLILWFASEFALELLHPALRIRH